LIVIGANMVILAQLLFQHFIVGYIPRSYSVQ